MLKRAAIKGMDLDKASGHGVRFYDFPRVHDMKAFKATYRERLDSLGGVTGQRGGGGLTTLAEQTGAPLLNASMCDLLVRKPACGAFFVPHF